MKTDIAKIKEDINLQLEDKETFNTLLATTFKGLNAQAMKGAILEGMMRGFTFADFLEKNVYAIPFKGNYSLVTSIDYARKIGMRSGIVGKDVPIYEEDENKNLISCAITVKKKVDNHIGDFTAKVYFTEYTTNKNLWVSKPRTMLAKVAEMHALRMACPEELSQQYLVEELEQSITVKPEVDVFAWEEKLKETRNIEELQKVWSNMPSEARTALEATKDKLKKKFEEEAKEQLLKENPKNENSDIR